MRIGSNPQKDKEIAHSDYFHQVVIPVYIPNQEGYFKDSFQIFKFCIESLFKTTHSKTYFTIVNNGSCKEIKDYLENLFEEKYIHELINTTNIGYINAMIKGVSGQNFPIITTADCDVLFLNGWQEHSYEVFEAFPKAGVVSPTPNSRMIKTLTNNILIENLFSKKMKFDEVIDPQSMIDFGHSVNNISLFKPIHLDKYLVINNKNTKAMVGASHFVATYRADVFSTIEKSSVFILGGNSDDVFDVPVIKKGFWRLSTSKNYAFHMGNVVEDWMKERFDLITTINNQFAIESPLQKIKINKIMNWLFLNFFSKILLKRPIWRLFLRYKGLTKTEADIY
jgi:hypothetical protein